MTNEELLMEEMSVSREVENASDRLKNKILNEYKSNNMLDFSDNLVLYKGKTEYTAFGITFNVSYEVYEVDDVRLLRKQDYYMVSLNKADIEKNTLTVLLLVYRNRVLSYSDDSLTHELMHFLQWAKKKEKYNDSKQLTNDLYTRAVCVLTNIDEKEHERFYTQEEKIIAWLIYLSTPREQDAYLNGYYAELKGKEDNYQEPQLLSVIRNYQNIIDDYEFLKKTGEIKPAFNTFKEFGVTPKSLKYMYTNGYERLINKKQRIDGLIAMENEARKKSVRQQLTEESLYRSYIKGIVREVLDEIIKDKSNYL